METITKKPSECSKTELQDFMSLVLAGGEVAAHGLKERICKAEALVFLVHNNCLKGIAAIKSPETTYKNSVFKKALATTQANQFPFELGWVFILPSSRGAGHSQKLISAALAAVHGQQVFATSRSDNTPMHKTLEKYNFSRHGKAYASGRGSHELVLFVSFYRMQ